MWAFVDIMEQGGEAGEGAATTKQTLLVVVLVHEVSVGAAATTGSTTEAEEMDITGQLIVKTWHRWRVDKMSPTIPLSHKF